MNDGGALGPGAGGAFSSNPIEVPGLPASVAVSVHDDTYSLSSTGEVHWWGGGAAGASPGSLARALDLGGRTAVQIARGGYHGCAVLSDGTAACWGRDFAGERGDGPAITAYHDAPTTVAAVEHTFRHVACGSDHSCAVTNDGTVLCWGGNWSGESSGTPGTWIDTPVSIPGFGPGKLQTALMMAAGTAHSCALAEDGTVHCWGSPMRGALGRPGTSPAPAPVVVSGSLEPLSQATYLSAHGNTTCARVASGDVYCWGNGEEGQLGGPLESNAAVRIVVEPDFAAENVEVGGRHVCARRADGRVYCWGNLGAPELGGSEPPSGGSGAKYVPVRSANGPEVTGGKSHTCAVRSGMKATVKCWGANDSGQLAADPATLSSAAAPVAVGGVSGITMIAAGDQHTCALSETGTISCWGANAFGQSQPAAPGGIVTVPSPVGPPPVPFPLDRARNLTAGKSHTCATTGRGDVFCWGDNSAGQLRSTPYSGPPHGPTWAGLEPAIQLAAGARHTCALFGSGRVACWGENTSGQLGDGPSSAMEASPPLPDRAVAIASGTNHSCAVLASSWLLCWGANESGQLGLGFASAPIFIPLPVLAPPSRSVVAGGNSTCALLANGRAMCWGKNDAGQLGDGTTVDRLGPASTLVLGAADPLRMGLGHRHACAVDTESRLFCWGALTGGTPGASLTPVLTPL
jgi:alpha-tubulin suppressor-like RCC1 family protein